MTTEKTQEDFATQLAAVIKRREARRAELEAAMKKMNTVPTRIVNRKRFG